MPSARLGTAPLHATDSAVQTLIAAAGAHGVYVANALAAGDGEGFVFGTDAPQGLCWFGARGNLVVLAPDAVPGYPVAEAVLAAGRAWRLAMGPAAVVDALRGRLPHQPVVHRDQVYYRGDAATAARELVVAANVRAAEPADRDRLVQATLQLNHSDLQLDPARVDRRWLYDTIDERIRDGTTRVLGPVGAPDCKLDLGSDGPGGLVIEGVFTFPAARGRGLASALVAAVLARAAGPVFLHVGRHNAPARAAYARAGMVPAGQCRLLLRG